MSYKAVFENGVIYNRFWEVSKFVDQFITAIITEKIECIIAVNVLKIQSPKGVLHTRKIATLDYTFKIKIY